jgi:hypothetical protein
VRPQIARYGDDAERVVEIQARLAEERDCRVPSNAGVVRRTTGGVGVRDLR